MRHLITASPELGQVVDLARNQRLNQRNLREPIWINNKKLVVSATDFDLYRKSDIDLTIHTNNPYLEFCALTENIPTGGVDANSPHIASIGSGASKVQVYSIFAYSVKDVPSFRASSSGIRIVNFDKDAVSDIPANIAWSVVSNGSKFFAYPVSTESTGKIVKTSSDGISWVSENLTGDYPDVSESSTTWRWFYNLVPTGYGVVPVLSGKTTELFSVGTNIFRLDESGLMRSRTGLDWTNITTSVFGNAVHTPRGFYVATNGPSAFIANVYGIRYTTDSGESWMTPVSTIVVPTSFGFTENPNSRAKYLAKNDTPNNLYYVSTNTGSTWSRVLPGVNADLVQYRNSTIVLAQKNSYVCKVSTNDGQTFSDVVFPSTFQYPVMAGVFSENFFYLVDSDTGLYRSSDGITWSLIGIINIEPGAFGRAKTVNSTTEIISSLDDNSGQPYVLIYNSGANFVSARFGERASSIIYPGIDGSTDVVVCNGATAYGSKTTYADIQNPPYMRFDSSKIPQIREGLYPYIRVG